MAYIFVLIGKSGSGKDSFFERLMEDKELNLKKIVGYTTRPIRHGEENGREYYFTDIPGLNSMREKGNVIEERCYHTVHGEWYYFTAKDENIKRELESSENKYLYIGTLESFAGMCDYYGRDKIIPLYIYVEDGIRLERALIREKKQEVPKYAEMCRRFLADEEDFSEENLKKAGIEKLFDNSGAPEECFKKLKDTILNVR